ncbi:MAG: hypothetical protein D4R67_00065 [Bacteroidetes bacterium]|nr:MAG: hypothetical protein D4R67_00065 [Bacteroidota bacterium]
MKRAFSTSGGAYIPHILLLGCFLTLLVILLISSGYAGGSDSIVHYQIARYVFYDPKLLFSLWGRPLFTLISVPFAQLGFTGMKLMNILLGVGSAWLAYLISKRLGYASSWMVIVFVLFAPLYCSLFFSGLTEVSFSFFLVLALFFFLREKYYLSALILSFLPFVRMEGLWFMPVFILALSWKRKWFTLPVLATGFLFYSIIGGFFFHDLLWIIHRFPYYVNHPVYSKYTGSLFLFYEKRSFILGLPLQWLFVAGIAGLIYALFNRKKKQQTEIFFQALVLTIIFLYAGLHSWLYWTGVGSSLGLIRVVGAILPLVSIISMGGYAWLERLFVTNQMQRFLLQAMTVVFILYANFTVYRYPVPLLWEEEVMTKTASWVRSTEYVNKRICYTDPKVPFYLDANPYDGEKFAWVLAGSKPLFTSKEMEVIPRDNLLIWDAHFGPNECCLPLDSLMRSPKMQLINYFTPAVPATTLGGYNYEVYLFLKGPAGSSLRNALILDSIRLARDSGIIMQCLVADDFERNTGAFERVDSLACSGAVSACVGEREFTRLFAAELSSFQGTPEGAELMINCAIFSPEDPRENRIWLVVSMEQGNRSLFYKAFCLNELQLKQNQWNAVSLSTMLPEIKYPDGLLKIYFWQKGSQRVIVDDVVITMLQRSSPGSGNAFLRPPPG